MKKNMIQMLLIFTTVIMTAACSSDSENEVPVVKPDNALTPIRITASYANGNAQSRTRVAYSESGANVTATWQSGDKLKVVYNGSVSTLNLESGAGTSSATFSGTVSGTPSATSMLICYVSDQNNTSAVTINNDGSYTYTDGTFLGQDGTLSGAAKCNLYSGSTFYGTGSDISCNFAVNTSMMKFTVFAPNGVSAGDEATLTYKSNGTAISKATFTVGAGGKNTIYLTIPAGQYTGEQTLVYNETSKTLSATKANFVAGETYSRDADYGSIPVGAVSGKYTINGSGNQVFFANGNLQYKSDTGWRFAEHQWDYTNNSNSENWVDHIDWATCISFSSTIINASNAAGWRTLSNAEWLYVFNSRETNATVNSTSNARYTEASINTDATAVKGVILIPDGYSGGTPTGVTWGTINAGSNFSTSCTSAGWAALEAAGCVFLPCAGFNTGDLQDVGTVGIYWSSTQYDSWEAYRIGFYINGLDLPKTNDKSFKFSVRLVCPV